MNDKAHSAEKDAPDEGCTCAEIAAVVGTSQLTDSTIMALCDRLRPRIFPPAETTGEPAVTPNAERDAGLWIEYGKHNNGLWIDARKVASVRNIGKGGSRGSILTLDNGHEFLTGYPATQLVAMAQEARATRPIPPGETQRDEGPRRPDGSE